MTVNAILREKGREVFTLPPDRALIEVCTDLSARRIGAVVIVDERERLVGILSERDVVSAIARGGAEALLHPAGDHMTRTVEVCQPSDRIPDVMARMTTGRFRHFPVVADEQLIGLISIGDVVKHRIAQAEREAAEIREYITTT